MKVNFIFFTVVVVTVVLGRKKVKASERCLNTLSVDALDEKFLMFDVVSEEDIGDLKERFEATEVLHSFKFIGRNRYIFVIRDEGDVDALRALELPEEASVDVYPVEHLSEFFKMYGVDMGWEEEDTPDALNDEVINMQWLTIESQEGDKGKTLKDDIANFATLIGPVHDEVRRLTYGVIAEYPPQLIFFNQIEANALQKLVKCQLDLLGGPANVVFKNYRLVKV